MNEKDYFSHLYEIASQLNKEFSLQATLRIALEKTVEILEVETGWFWLTEPNNQSVYLAASYNLPPALSDHPERLSGWCYCIKQYLSDDIDQAVNISEITCSRLKDIRSGTKGLKFHASIPVISNGEKVGLLNLLSKETRQLGERELTVLNTISELIGTAIQRTRLQSSYSNRKTESATSLQQLLSRIFHPQMEVIISCLEGAGKDGDKISTALSKATELKEQLTILSKELSTTENTNDTRGSFAYPESPLTKRELEVLSMIKKGFTNNQIGEKLFIAERTVKFHVTAILSKLHADTRTQAVDIALNRGLIGI